MRRVENIAKLAEKLISRFSVVDPQKRDYPQGMENVSHLAIRVQTVKRQNKRENRNLLRLLRAYNNRKRQNNSEKSVVRLNVESRFQRKRSEYSFGRKRQRERRNKYCDRQIHFWTSATLGALLLEIKICAAKKYRE